MYLRWIPYVDELLFLRRRPFKMARRCDARRTDGHDLGGRGMPPAFAPKTLLDNAYYATVPIPPVQFYKHPLPLTDGRRPRSLDADRALQRGTQTKRRWVTMAMAASVAAALSRGSAAVMLMYYR